MGLSDAEMQEIMRLHAEQISARGIGARLGRNHKTILRAIQRYWQRPNTTVDQKRAVAAMARGFDRYRADRESLRPSAVTATPFSPAWWRQNDESFRRACGGGLLEVSTRINVGSAASGDAAAQPRRDALGLHPVVRVAARRVGAREWANDDRPKSDDLR